MNADLEFLSGQMKRSWIPKSDHGLRPAGLYIGEGVSGIEVAVARVNTMPASGVVGEIWRYRRSGRAAPVLLVLLGPDETVLCGPSGEQPPVYRKVDRGQVERMCQEALAQPDRHAALRYLAQALPSLETPIPGLANEGLLAINELQRGTPNRSDWSDAGERAQRVAGQRDRNLLTALGYQIEGIDNLTSLLRNKENHVALAVLLKESESPEAGTARFNNLSPVSYALAKADAQNLPWVVMVQGSRLRLYSKSVDAGVGRRGRTETYVECQPTLLSDAHLPYLWLLFSANALASGGSLEDILENSQRFAGELARRLRERIYEEVMPTLAQGLAATRSTTRLDDLGQTYEMALTVLFRLLFIAYAEDRDLLPYKLNDVYRRRSLKQKAKDLADLVANNQPIAEGNHHWQETMLLWQAVASGNPEWSVPAYNGGLFSDDPDVSPVGAALAEVQLPNRVFETALRALLVTEVEDGEPGPVDFRSLSVREFGTIYEGLLESDLAVAETDLAVDTKGNLMPAKRSEEVEVPKGAIYLHNRSGQRKASGSYYTKHFAVEHLLDGALEPALQDHFTRLSALDDADAAEHFFDFRVADIAMGSGHFLIAAIDRIEKGMADCLAGRPLPGVGVELATLREAAMEALGELADATVIEDGQLLRRMIARRCIYGVDMNALTVQLARLSVWIHTFVPGLPLSVLDHSLVHGNALVGIGTVSELRARIQEITDDAPLLTMSADDLVGDAARPLNRLARLNDATLGDIARAREAIREASDAISETRELCDFIAALPLSSDIDLEELADDGWEAFRARMSYDMVLHAAYRELEGLHPLHFLVAFPEVFLRDRPGFDVILGNPPWQEATLEEDAFWARHFPGLRGLSQRQQESEKNRFRKDRPDLQKMFVDEIEEMARVRKVLIGGAYPGMGTGDPDLYKAFCWRFWNLVAREGGRIGVVLPRSALAAKGSAEFRKTMFENSAAVDVTMLLNSAGWVFDEAEHRYTIGLTCITRGTPNGASIHLRGPYRTLNAFEAGVTAAPAEFRNDDVLAWNDTSSLPLLPTEKSLPVFAQLRKAPRLDRNVPSEWRARPDREMDATNQKNLMDLVSEECPEGYWPIYKGESFDLWTPDTGTYYAFAEPTPAQEWIQSKRWRARNSKRSPHSEFRFRPGYLRNMKTLACHKPRIAFRDITNRTNQRTVIACLVPQEVFIANSAPYFLWRSGDERDQAFLLGVLCSIPLDWYARRFVETHVSFFVVNPFPIPRPERVDPAWQRVVELAGRLASPDERFGEWAEAVGVSYGPVDDAEKNDMIHELDAVVAHLYGLDEGQLVHIFETFHESWDYHARLDGVLRHFAMWSQR